MKTIFYKKLLLSVLIIILLIPHLTSAQISRVKPLVNYEVNKQIPSLNPQERGDKRKSNKWFVKIGANTTFANYNKYNKKINIFFGVGRSYHKSGIFSFNWEVFYKSREFLLQNQRVYRPYPYYYITYYDIDVSNSYIDIFLTPSVKLFDFSKSNINISFGLFLSAPVAENTNYTLKPLRKYTTDTTNVDFRFYPEDQEPDLFIDVFIGLAIGIEYELGKKIIQLKYCNACGSTDQIRRFTGKSRLNTLELMIGYKF
ncbi:MAG: hypothetical protein JEY97_14540 [Bacteroidales bacterium]|nr:hypothetical protein [Bacteroidales bacterium]